MKASLDSNAKKRKLMNRISRATGQLNAVKTMIEAEESCVDIAQQLSAARAALDKTYFELMACAIEKSVLESNGTDWQQDLSDLTGTLVKYA